MNDDLDATFPLPRPTAVVPAAMTDEAAGALFDAAAPAFATQRTTPVGGWEPPSVEDLQQALPQYEISAFLARGGMGAVYRGLQRSLKRPVAIKVLPPDIQDGDLQYAARFKQEAESMARLSHPNIVAVFDAGETAGGLLYFVMEYIEGTDVAQLIASEGRLEPRRAIQITTAVCEALAFAHEEGIIHRDIKPSNIMIDRKGRVKVADFGLAKSVHLDSTLLTGSNVAMGTPDFIAPEAMIPGIKLDQRADLYAVGVMLYQMLTGHIPRGRFELPSGVVPQVDKGFDAVVDKAMQTDREKRYSTAIEMKTDVERVGSTPDASEAPLPAAATRGAPQAPARGVPLKSPPAGKGPPVPKKPNTVRDLVIVAVLLAVVGAGAFFATRRPPPGAAAGPTTTAAQETVPADTAPPAASVATATKQAPFVNSLGMKFVPVPITGGPTDGKRVLFSIWDTRVKDYEVFVNETRREWPKDKAWPPEIPLPTGEHPAVNMTWDDARAFCAWLTERERKSGRIGAKDVVRLPTDHEWSCAVGIGAQEDAKALPADKNGKLSDVFPWGSAWPPPAGAGNYLSEEIRAQMASKVLWTKGDPAGYQDGHAMTAPVGSFPANAFGLYDMGGNVWQWCEDGYDHQQKDRVVRGASWNYHERSMLLSSARNHDNPGQQYYNNGFRCVLEDGDVPDKTRATETSGAGDRHLFDGKSLSGWHGLGNQPVPSNWHVTEGVMTGGPMTGGKGTCLVSDEELGDFDLSLEWRVKTGGNGGIVFLISAQENGGQFDTKWPEFNLMDDALASTNRSGSLFGAQETTRTTAVKPVGDWNTARLVNRGGKVEHWLNDQLVCAYDLNDPATRERWKGTKTGGQPGFAAGKRGRIGLQGWNGEISYRNVVLHSASVSAQPWQRIDFATMDAADLSNGKTYSGKDGDTFHLAHDEMRYAPGPSRGPEVRNGAIRATVRWDDKTFMPRLVTRMGKTKQYAAHLSPTGIGLNLYDGADHLLQGFNMPAPFKAGDTVVFQLASIGTQHFLWVDGRLVGTVEDASHTDPGILAIQANNAHYLSMEWLPLDGLSEAEALKVLGIKE